MAACFPDGTAVHRYFSRRSVYWEIRRAILTTPIMPRPSQSPLRRNHEAHCRILPVVILLSLPAQAIGPLAFIAKDLVKGIVRSFVEGQIDKMLASAGPCGLPIAGPGAGGLAGMLGGRGAMPGLSSMRGAGKMPLSGVAGAAKGAFPSMHGMGGGAAMPPGMEGMMKDQMAQAQAMMAKEQAKHGTDVEDKESLGKPGAMPDMAKTMQAMQEGEPLTRAEVDELATLLERMSTAMPSAAPQCKPGELKTVLQQASDSPMTGGMLR